MLKRIVALIVFATATAGAAAAQQAQPGSLTDVTGTWVMLIEGHQVAVELEQKESKVEGIMHAMGQRILLIGEYTDRTLTLKGERPEDTIAHHGNDAGPIVAKMLDNGTLEGERSTNRGRTKWTGEPFTKR
jgi:hypothetical protein